MPRLKVLHVITTLPRLSGAADNTRYTVNLLDRDRYEVHLACGPAELDASGVAPHVRLIVLPSMVRPIAPIRDVWCLWTLVRLLRREQYAIIHTHNSKAGIIGRLAAHLAGVRVVVHTAHTISFASSTHAVVNLMYRWAERAVAPLTSRIVTVSSMNTATYLAARIGRPEMYTLIYSGVETSLFTAPQDRAACRRELGVLPSDLVVLWIGRLNRQKDPLTCIRACRLIADRYPAARFFLVGEDSIGESLLPSVRALVERLGLDDQVTLLGYRRDIPRLLAAADLVLHTSLYEGLGRSIVESMLAGVPLVATAVDGVADAIDSGRRGGLLVAPRDPEALAAAASTLLGDRALAARVVDAGRRWAAERFEVAAMVRALDRLYGELMPTAAVGES